MVSIVDSGVYCLVHLGKHYCSRIHIFHFTSSTVDCGAAQTFALLPERGFTDQCSLMSAFIGHAICFGG